VIGPFAVGVRAPPGPLTWPDLRLAPAALAGWAIAIGVLLLGPRRGSLLLGGCVLLLAGAVVLVHRHRSLSVRTATWSTVVVLVSVVGIGGAALARVASVRPEPVLELVAAGASARVDLVVTGDPVPLRSQWSADRVRVACRLERVDSARVSGDLRVPVTVFAPATWRPLLPGTRVSTRARFGPTGFRDEAALLVVRGAPSVIGEPHRVQRAAGRLRAGLRDAVAGFGPDPRGLVPGMVLGDTSGVSAELQDAERVAGLTHLTAVSGANVAVLLATVLGVARALGARRRLLLAIGLAAVLGFVVVARPEPSVVRAAVMGSIALIGVMRGTTGRGAQILAAGVVLLLVVNPWFALSMGFALSVVATGALLLVAPWWRDRLSTRLPVQIAEPLAVATVAHLATAPLIAALSGHVSLVAIGANLAAEPAVVIVTVCGSLATVVSPLSETLAQWCALPAGWGAWWVAQVAHTAAGLPFAEVAWPSGPVGIVALLALVATVLVRAPTLLGGRGMREPP
jgi:competence protein ComEC